jgi:hypothetical protein
VDAYWLRWALGISEMKKFLYEIPEWRPFYLKVLTTNAKIQKDLNPDITDEQIDIYNDGFTEAFVVLFETVQLQPFLKIIKAIGDDYES